MCFRVGEKIPNKVYLWVCRGELNTWSQLLTENQCIRWDYVDIDYFIGPKFQRKRCRHNLNLVSYFPLAAAWGYSQHGPKSFHRSK